ncbi:MAG: pyrroline-5-carboxylate reductase [Puniceicoccales bacterium]|jgi:pyrroline-5-carboxylate reductase|nr:pyrroline-5-carboxylate reductase [Puniceicoccales bacterium]
MSEIVFLGAGKMAGAIVRGLISGGVVPPSAMACLGGSGTSAPALAAATGIRLASGIDDLLDGAETLVIACKPQQFKLLDPRLGELAAGKLVISIMAGFSVQRLAAFFPEARSVAAVMPNTPAQVRSGVSVWTAPASMPPQDAALVEKYLGCVGKVVRSEAALMDAVCAASGSGPGFFFEVVDAFEKAAEGAGLSAAMARMLVRGTFIGAAKLLEQTGESPETLRNAVTSPNGTTFAGLQVLAKHDLRGIFGEVVHAAKTRSSELGKL